MSDGKYHAGPEAYRDQALALLPRGAAWPTDDPGSVLTRFWSSIGDGLARHHARALDLLLRESLPVASLELLPDWERVAGLPDECTPVAASVEERRNALATRLGAQGGQSIAYYEGLADRLGYPVEVEERFPFQCGGSELGGTHEIAPEAIRYRWRMRVLEPRVTRFRAGISECGIHPLTDIRRANDLECVVSRVQPAHGVLDFSYEGI